MLSEQRKTFRFYSKRKKRSENFHTAVAPHIVALDSLCETYGNGLGESNVFLGSKNTLPFNFCRELNRKGEIESFYSVRDKQKTVKLAISWVSDPLI